MEDKIAAFSALMTVVFGDDTDAACDGVTADSYDDSGDDSEKPVNVRSPSSSPPPVHCVTGVPRKQLAWAMSQTNQY